MATVCRSCASSAGTPSLDFSNAFSRRAASVAAPLLAASSKTLSNVPKGRATEVGSATVDDSCFLSSARLSDFPPTRPAAKSLSARAHLSVAVVLETVILGAALPVSLALPFCKARRISHKGAFMSFAFQPVLDAPLWQEHPNAAGRSTTRDHVQLK